jgi:IS30 family transposase
MPPKVDLAPYREAITGMIAAKTEQKMILARLLREHDLRISRKTLVRAIEAWDLQRKPYDSAPELNEAILSMYKQRLHDSQILDQLQADGCNISPWKLQQLRTTLGLLREHNYKDKEAENSELNERLTVLFARGELEGLGQGLLQPACFQHDIFASRFVRR